MAANAIAPCSLVPHPVTTTGSPAWRAARIATARRPADVSRPGASSFGGTPGTPELRRTTPRRRSTRPDSAGSAAIISVIHHGGPSRCAGAGSVAHGAGGPDSVASGSGWARTVGSNGGGSSMPPMIGSTTGDAD